MPSRMSTRLKIRQSWHVRVGRVLVIHEELRRFDEPPKQGTRLFRFGPVSMNSSVFKGRGVHLCQERLHGRVGPSRLGRRVSITTSTIDLDEQPEHR